MILDSDWSGWNHPCISCFINDHDNDASGGFGFDGGGDGDMNKMMQHLKGLPQFSCFDNNFVFLSYCNRVGSDNNHVVHDGNDDKHLLDDNNDDDDDDLSCLSIEYQRPWYKGGQRRWYINKQISEQECWGHKFVSIFFAEIPLTHLVHIFSLDRTSAPPLVVTIFTLFLPEAFSPFPVFKKHQ